eukprot:CAMPEP_0179234654 /NCGR_PEP_ID=MMETSP0797-20121207/13004_1 /TAXON_ID=47934 /ORGANISM="Dinophysis acuminata, Strain DAEP01" /LENGTH=570 /DNA_ID=CAMNT_0020941847 /DNA_START=82 /DNA_END=1794 /DNA_ORIENTATION=+
MVAPGETKVAPLAPRCCPGVRRRCCASAVALSMIGAVALRGFSLARSGPARSMRGEPRQLVELCSAKASVQWPVTPVRAFDLPKYWRLACEKVPPAPSRFTTDRWEGQNACWGWMKKLGCYEAEGDLSWRQAQIHAAKQGYAPFPEVATMQPVREPELCDRPDLGMLNNTGAEEVEAATAWLNANVAVYVLNLLRDTGRWSAISGRLTQLGIEFQRIPGVDLSGRDAINTSKRAGLVPWGFNFTLAQLNADSHKEGMGGILGTVGCAAAHLNAMKTVRLEFAHPLQGRTKPLALILEDDVMVMNDFAVKLKRLLLAEAPCDWAVISLKTRCPYGTCVSPHLTRVFPDGNEPASRCRHGVNYGFFAMLYRLSTLDTLRSKLASVVWDADRPHCLDVDVALASISDEVAYYAVPHLQKPGFLFESGHPSVRWALNQDRHLDDTATTTTATTGAPAVAAEPARVHDEPLRAASAGASVVDVLAGRTTGAPVAHAPAAAGAALAGTAAAPSTTVGRPPWVAAATTTATFMTPISDVLLPRPVAGTLHRMSEYREEPTSHHADHDLQVPWQHPKV